MRNNGKKILSLVAAATFLGATFALAGCGKENYSGEKLNDYVSSQNAAVSNGGFAVEKDGFIYFINGAESYTASNTYGEVVKGALMRISKTDLEEPKADSVKMVVPMLISTENKNAGIYIFGDYVYYATPTTDKNLSGEVESSWIDFKRAKLDGTDTMKDYYFRLENNTANYRFVEENGTVYCLYEEDSMLKSFNTATRETNVLVKGAKSSFFYDTKDATNANVYYTMSVVYDADSANSLTASYDQLYCVNAAATATVDADKAAYTVKGGKTYDFDEAYLKKQNEEAKSNKTDEPYDFNDYSTYPYVNLGTLVLDGIGANSTKETQFNTNSKADALTPDGYNYTISSYQNGGVYFTRAEVTKTSSAAENTKLYYLSDDTSSASEWNSVTANDKLAVVALDTANATSSAIYYITESGAHEYLYIANNILYKAQPDVKGEANAFALAYNVSGATLWTLEGDYLYYTVAGTNGNNLVRINYTGVKNDYHPITAKDDYKPLKVSYIDYNSGWLKPEFFGSSVLFCNARADGATSYNYVYTAELGTWEEIDGLNKEYDAVQEEIGKYSNNTALQTAMKYYFQTGERTLFDAVKDLYSEYQIEKFDAFVNNAELKEYSHFATLVGEINEDDKEAIEEAWKTSLLTETEEEAEDEGMPTWALWLIIGGSVVVVAVAAWIIVKQLNAKKAKKMAEEATVNAYKRKKIDTTDDKSIDVYADDEAEEKQD